MRDVAAEDDKTDGERGGKNQADGAPERGPENGGDENGERGDAGVNSVKGGLDEV